LLDKGATNRKRAWETAEAMASSREVLVNWKAAGGGGAAAFSGSVVFPFSMAA